jgi:hypothetical protein
MEQVTPTPPIKKAWPLMTPAERLAIWEEARLAWTHISSRAGTRRTTGCNNTMCDNTSYGNYY